MENYGTVPERFARIGPKNHRHSVNNPYSHFRDEYSLEEIKAAPMVWAPLTELQCCPMSGAAGAAIDCFSANELITYETLGLRGEGTDGEFIDGGANTYGGKVVVNPSGGLISKGHPLGAMGLAQCAELNWQVRGQAEKRQVKDAKIALQHNLGLGGAAVVTMYRKAQLG